MKLRWILPGFISLAMTASLAADTDSSNDLSFSSAKNAHRILHAKLNGKVALADGQKNDLDLVNANHKSMQYSLSLLQKINNQLSTTQSKERSVLDAENTPLERLGLSSYSSAATVKDLYNHLKVRLSDKYQYSLQPIPKSLASKATGSEESSVSSNMLMMPFSDIFTLEPGSIRYMADLLNIFSNVNPRNAKMLASSFGISSKSLHTPESTKSVARLLATISNMDPKSLNYLSNSDSAGSSDPLVTKGSLFTLSSILAISPDHLDSITRFFSSLSQMDVLETKSFLQSVGWQSSDAGAESSNAIPDLSYLFPMNEDMISSMTQVAKQSTYDLAGVAPMAEKVRVDVSGYLKEAGDFWKALPDYFSLASLLSLANNPFIGDLIQFLSISYKNPEASFWQLLLLYYKSIGMPGLQSIIDAPSQYIGSLASSVVGGYVSNIVTSIVGGILDFKPTASTPAISSGASATTATVASSATAASPTPTLSLPTARTSSSSASPSSASASSSSASSSSYIPASTPTSMLLSTSGTSMSSVANTSMTKAPASSATQSAYPSSSVTASSVALNGSTALPRPSPVASTPTPSSASTASSSLPLSNSNDRNSSSSSISQQAAAAATQPTTSITSGNNAAAPLSSASNGNTSSSISSSSSTYDFWGFLSYFSPGKPIIPADPEMSGPTTALTATIIYGTVMIPHSTKSV